MIVAVSILLQKDDRRTLTNRLRAYVYYSCNSQNEAIGIASVKAMEDNPDFNIASFTAIEITPPANHKSEAAQQTTTAWRSLCKWLKSHFAMCQRCHQ